MNTLNVQKVQLPDGTLLTIQGGDAANTAQIIANRLGGSRQEPPPSGSHVEPPLVMPTLNFARRGDKAQHPAQPLVTSQAGEEPPLPPTPSLAFTRR
jgi:hypothetical protein